MNRITTFADGDWREVSFDRFEREFLDICQAHRAQGRALAFAFILCDRSHPYVREALAHQFYWDALDARSGTHLSVFSFDVRCRAVETGAAMNVVYTIQAPSVEQQSAALSEYFEDLSAEDLPCVLFFQVDDGMVVDTECVTIQGEGLEATYQELENLIGTAADAVAGVEAESAENSQAIFNLIKISLRSRSEQQVGSRFVEFVRPYRQLALQYLLRMVLDN